MQFAPRERKFMQEALAQGEKALKEGEVPVGCVFVHKDKVIGVGHNMTVQTRNATRHAEFEAIDQILAENDPTIFEEAELYVTVEPCIMCASALLMLKVKKVYCGCMNDKFGGCGSIYNVNQTFGAAEASSSKELFGRNYECINGLFEKEAIELLRSFYSFENPLAPKPKKKKRKVEEQS